MLSTQIFNRICDIGAIILPFHLKMLLNIHFKLNFTQYSGFKEPFLLNICFKM